MSGRRFKSALVLSGGSARGLSHLGVLERLERHRVKIDMIVGSSMGSIIGALYAYYRDPSMVVARLRRVFESDLFTRTVTMVAAEDTPQLGADGFFNRFMWLFRKGVYYTHSMLRTELISVELYEEIMAILIPDARIEELPIPFAAIAMDLMTGEEIVITRGSLRSAVAASSAIPGLLPAVRMNERWLVDGGWVDNVPVAPAIALGAHFTVAVDATLEVPGMSVYPQSALEILFRCNELTRIILTRHRKSYADVMIAPEIGPLFWADFRAIDKCMEAGRKAYDQEGWNILKKIALRRSVTLQGIIHPGRVGDWKHPFLII